MPLVTESYTLQRARWPTSGRHILAQHDERSVVVYQAYAPPFVHEQREHLTKARLEQLVTPRETVFWPSDEGTVKRLGLAAPPPGGQG